MVEGTYLHSCRSQQDGHRDEWLCEKVDMKPGETCEHCGTAFGEVTA